MSMPQDGSAQAGASTLLRPYSDALRSISGSYLLVKRLLPGTLRGWNDSGISEALARVLDCVIRRGRACASPAFGRAVPACGAASLPLITVHGLILRA